MVSSPSQVWPKTAQISVVPFLNALKWYWQWSKMMPEKV